MKFTEKELAVIRTAINFVLAGETDDFDVAAAEAVIRKLDSDAAPVPARECPGQPKETK